MVDTIETEESLNNAYQLNIANISWNTTTNIKNKKILDEDLPTTVVIDVPQNVLNQANKKSNNFNDIIESYVYNSLSRKFGHELYHCQIYLPLDK